MTTKIEWADESWNPITGCTQITAGCRNCYAKRMARRLAGRYGYPEAPNEFDVTLRPERLDQPLKWRKPKRIFVVSMGDLFHEDVPTDYILRVWRTMYLAKQHQFLVLTKRPERMQIFVQEWLPGAWTLAFFHIYPGPFPNIHLGVTAENQEQADKRVPLLLQTPAAVRFVSVEPCLSAVDLWRYIDPASMTFAEAPLDDGLDLVIVGAETGPGARPMELAWARDLRDQCKAAGTPYFFKKATGGVTPDDLMIREFPQ